MAGQQFLPVQPAQQSPSQGQSATPLAFYNPAPVLYLPVTPQQVISFNPRERGLPSRVMLDGSEYYGELCLDQPHGLGIMLFKSSSSPYGNGARYGGAWRSGQPHGKGVVVTSEFTYHGEWVEGKMHGRGEITYTRRVTDAVLRGISLLSPFDTMSAPLEYVGDFHHRHHRHGRGVMRYLNGDVYDGEWASNRRHGQGRFVTNDGEIYEGQWCQDERHGYGKIMYANGGEFKGLMAHDKRHGEGVMVFPKGDEYYGSFENDKIKGHGTMRYTNGDVYEGMWKDGLRHGEGKSTLRKQGATVEGCFVNGLIQGRGVVQHPGVSTFVGEFDRGERRHGTLFWHASSPGDRACYQGEWLGETIHNRGLLWYRNGDFFFGQFVKNKRHGPGNIRYADGSEYSGHFVQDMREGKGILQNANGFIQAGLWRADVFVEGYDGEWDGVTFHGIGRLRLREPPTNAAVEHGNTTLTSASNQGHNSPTLPSASATPEGAAPSVDTMPGIEHSGLFCKGRRHGAGILRTAGHVIMGSWTEDVLSCEEGLWEFPSGDVYVGGFQGGFREGTDGRMWFSDGSFFTGSWHLDAPAGTGVFCATDHKDPIYAPEENAPNTAALLTDSRDAGTDNSSGFFSAMGYFMNFFRSKAVQTKENPRRVIGYREHFVLQGEWDVTPLSYTSYEFLMARSSAGGDSSCFGTAGAGGSNKDNNSNSNTHKGKAGSGAAVGSASELHSGFSGVKNSFWKQPTCVLVGTQERRGVFVFKSGVGVRTEWLFNHPRLMLPHRPDAPFYNKISGGCAGKNNSGVDSLKNCSFCERPFSFFRKETSCVLCERSSCGSCLHPIEVRNNPKIEALVRLRMTKPEGDANVTSGGGGLAKENIVLPTRVPACVDCARTSLLDVEFNTIWIPMHCCAATGELQNASVTSTRTETTTPLPSKSFEREMGTETAEGEESSGPPTFALASVADEAYIVYEGYTCNCVPHIYGSLWWGKQGGYYLGSFDEGRRHGRGVQMMANGEKYVGDFLNDKWHGAGIYCADDGSVYEGLWEHGKLKTLCYHGEVDEQYRRHGRGRSYEAHGVRYNGEWMQGQRHGSGMLQSENGVVYRGDFAFGRMEGEGTLLLERSVFYGNFCDGKREGKGAEYFGEFVFQGEWKDDLLSGCVRVYDGINETVYETTYENGNERDDCFVLPVMVDDVHSTDCAKCHAVFSLFLRRHHCRLCGKVFCDNCSQRRATMPLHFKADGQKRVCDFCYQRIEQRRMLGIKRYKNGEVYAGCWTQGHWVSHGLLRRADGTIVVMDSSGSPLVATSEEYSKADGKPSSPPPSPPSSAAALQGPSTDTTTVLKLPLDASPSAEELRKLPASSNAEVDAFALWWNMTLSVLGVSLPLVLTPCTAFKLPHPPSMKPPRLFVSKDDVNNDGHCANSHDIDGEVAMRAARYFPSIPPHAPAFPVSSSLSSGSLTLLSSPPPPRPVITDAQVMHQISDGRAKMFSSGGPQMPPSEGQTAVSSSCHRRALLPPTPLQPLPEKSERIRWDNWGTHPVPQYAGGTTLNAQQGAAEWQRLPFVSSFLRPVVDDVDRAVRGESARWIPKPFVGPQLFVLSDTREGVAVVQKEVMLSSLTKKSVA